MISAASTIRASVVLSFCNFALAQAPCGSCPVSFVEIGDSTAPNYIGVTFKYSNGISSSDLLRAGGISLGDFDNDGLTDMVFPGGQNQAMMLAKNLGHGVFSDAATSKGLLNTVMRQGAAILFDYDHDGDLDILATAHGVGLSANLVKLFRNSGAAGNYVFNDVTASCGFAFDPATIEPTTNGHVGGITVGDYTGDGYLDVFMTWWNAGLSSPQNDMWRLFSSEPNPNPATNDPNIPNQTPRIFVDRTVAAGLNINLDTIPDLDGGPIGGDAWQPTFVDIDNDGWVDLHVCVDFGGDFMYLNNKNGTFTDRATPIGLNGAPPQVRNEMGSAFADVDNDGDLDVYLTNVAGGSDGSPTDPKVYRDRFYRNDSHLGRLRFVDMGPATGVMNSEFGWGTIAADLDNDADLDHLTVSGHRVVDDPFINRLHVNLFPTRASDGLSPLYCDATSFVPAYSHVLSGDDVGRNLQALDFDDDGDLDLVVGHSTDTTSVVPGKRYEFFLNTQSLVNDWIAIDLTNTAGSLNTVNSRVWLRTSGRTQHQQLLAGSSFHGQSNPRLHFGLGSAGASEIDWAIVRWPGKKGNHQYVTNLIGNQVNDIVRTNHNWLGDVNVDGKLDLADIVILLNAIAYPDAFAASHPDWPGYVLGDTNGDNALTIDDVSALLSRHGTQKQ